jgi:hypothetical protein
MGASSLILGVGRVALLLAEMDEAYAQLLATGWSDRRRVLLAARGRLLDDLPGLSGAGSPPPRFPPGAMTRTAGLST